MIDPKPGSPSLQPGALLEDRYQILEQIGQGGFATVYRALHLTLNREVAIKHLQASPAEPGHDLLLERALREARALASVEHPHVVRVYDAYAGPRAWIAMELLRGHELDHELRAKGPMPLDRALKLFLPLLDGLATIHAANIVHKDIKPSNLFLVDPGTPRERLVLLDFSVSGSTKAHAERLTGRFELAGTLQYMSPEYIADQHISPALDIYQVGLTLAECLTGRPAMDASDPRECMMRHCHGDLDLPGWLREGPVGSILARALDTDPARRPSSAAFYDALADLTPDVVSSPRVTRPLYAALTRPRSSVVSAPQPPVQPPTAPPARPTALTRAPRAPSRHAPLVIALILSLCSCAVASALTTHGLTSWWRGAQAERLEELSRGASPETPALPPARARERR